MDLEAHRRLLAGTFDEVAELYDEVRPRYPEALVDHVIAYSGIPEGGRILEIGAGPGNATLAFARRGYGMLSLEPGPRLAALCRENAAAFPAVRVVTSRLEDWPLEIAGFDLAISGQAFHWTDPSVAYDRTADALRAGGWLASFWNRPAPSQTPSELDLAILRAYQEHAPQLVEQGGRSLTGHGPPGEAMLGSGRFEALEQREFRWSRRLDAAAYGKLERTHSDHRALGPERLDALVSAVEAVVERAGGIELDYITSLFMSRRI